MVVVVFFSLSSLYIYKTLHPNMGECASFEFAIALGPSDG